MVGSNIEKAAEVSVDSSAAFWLFSFQYIDLLFSEQESIRHEWYHTIKCVANTEQQSNACERRSPDTRRIENKRNAEIDRICYDRLK